MDTATHAVSLPAAFWNQHMTNWVEVAMCGRPSDFLHETIISVTTTKAKLTGALRQAGFRDADAWVDNVADFPRVRGDRALILLEVELEGKKEVFPLDELLAYQHWGVTIGPFGWMFKGDPERPAGAKAAAPADAEKGSARQQVLADDPQIALQFKGIQHLSQSFMDHPLCYDAWVYPTVRYQRNYAVTPKTLAVPKTKTGDKEDAADVSLGKFWVKVFDSNGEIPVTLSFRKVSEEDFLTTMAGVWHNAAYAEHIKKQLPIARQIDADKAQLAPLVPEMRKLADSGKPREDILQSETFAKIALLTAQIERGYAALDAAWVEWSADHPVFEAADDTTLDSLKEQSQLWREHMVDTRERAAQLCLAEEARFKIRAIDTPEKKAAAADELRKLTGQELLARSRATLLEIKHVLRYWKHEKSRLTADDTRTDWIRAIDVQVELANAKESLGKAGVELGGLLIDGRDATAAREVYQKAVARVTLGELRATLADIEFEISKRESIEGDPDLGAFIKRRDSLKAQIKALEDAMKPK